MENCQPRIKILEDELLQTESNYIRDLTILVETFVEPLREWLQSETFCKGKQNPEYCLETVMFEEDIDVVSYIFSDLKLILNYNKFFYDELCEAVRNDGGERIALVFINHAPFMKMYSKYIENYDRANVLLTRLRANDSRLKQASFPLSWHLLIVISFMQVRKLCSVLRATEDMSRFKPTGLFNHARAKNSTI
jgi:hypothetical protein